jgi:copper chaperone CopZ
MKGIDLNMYETKVKIDGMMCGMCESHINDAIRNAFSVKKVSTSHSKGEADIISEEPIDEAKLRETITKTGYDFVSMTSKPYEKHGLFAFLKK